TLSGRVNVDGLSVVKNGREIPLSRLLPNFVHMESWMGQNGARVNKPTCAAGGQQKIIVTPQSIPTNIGKTLSADNIFTPVGAAYFSASNMGSYWRINISTWSGAMAGNGWAIASTYCLY